MVVAVVATAAAAAVVEATTMEMLPADAVGWAWCRGHVEEHERGGKSQRAICSRLA